MVAVHLFGYGIQKDAYTRSQPLGTNSIFGSGARVHGYFSKGQLTAWGNTVFRSTNFWAHAPVSSFGEGPWWDHLWLAFFEYSF